MGDINKYILIQNIRGFVANLGLTEMITNTYGGEVLGKTRSNKKGQTIDGICVSQGIVVSQEGYLPFHNSTK